METKPKQYTVQEFRIHYVRAKDRLAKDRRVISHPNDAAEFFRKYLFDMPIEKVVIIALSNKNQVIGFNCVEGTVNQCVLYPSNVFRFLLSAGAAAFIIAHNHPGGGTQPSEADWKITKRLQQAGKILEVPMFDHLIVSDEDVISLKEKSRWGES